MFTLIAMGTGVAYLYSVVAMALPDAFPAAFRDAHSGIALYFEAAAVITVLVLLGQVFELRARASTSDAIRALIDLAPKIARRIRRGRQRRGRAARQRRCRRTAARAPRRKDAGRRHRGRRQICGRRIHDHRRSHAGDEGARRRRHRRHAQRSGGFVMRAEKVGRDTMLAQIVNMVAAAQRSRAPIARLADQVAAWFVPAVIAVALVAFAVWAVFGPQPRLAYALVAAVTVLIIACPCALGLATPMSIMVGVGRAARYGILDQKRRSAGAHGEGRHARRRQDRHADRRQSRKSSTSSRQPVSMRAP